MTRTKLKLEDAIHDSPQTQAALAVCEEDAQLLRKFTHDLHGCCERVHAAQQELVAATRGLASQMKKYNDTKFPLEKKDSCMSTTFPLLADYMDEISHMQEMIASQVSTSMINPISRFISADLEELSQLQNLYRLISDEHEMSVQRYAKLPQRCGEQERCDAIDEVYHMRKKLHRTALHYFSSMNLVQRKRQFVFLESMASHLKAHLDLFKAGSDYVDREELDTLHGTTRGLLLCGHRELELERAGAAAAVASLEAAFDDSAYQPEPLEPSPPPQALATTPAPQQPVQTRRSGYLMLRCRPGPPGPASRWERLHFTVGRGGRLMCRPRRQGGQPPGGAPRCLLDLRRPAAAAAAPADDVDDRRHVFVVRAPGFSPLILQTESARDRSDWVAVINAAAAGCGPDHGEDGDNSESDEDADSADDAEEDGDDCDEAWDDDAEESAPQPRLFLTGVGGGVAGAAFSRTFAVQLLGHCRVRVADDGGNGDAAASADAVLRNAASAPPTGGERLLLAVSDQGVCLVEPGSRLTRRRFPVDRARLFPAGSRRLLALAGEARVRQRGRNRWRCFECLALRLVGDADGQVEQDSGGFVDAGGAVGQTAEAVCAALKAAGRSAAGFGHGDRETALLLSNIGRLPDATAEAPPPTPPPRRPLSAPAGSADDGNNGGEGGGGSEDEGGESLA